MPEQKIALYRKYRPENFDQVIGQDQIIKVLKNAILESKLSHAYIFSGPRGTGKTSIARILAKTVNCEKRTSYNPCGKCVTCKNIKEGQTMDLLEIDAASNRGIDEIRDLREKVKFAPSDSKYKVFIIDEVHMLTKEAFNALLKTLEEPPEHAIFILATTEINKVPSTIISRCQRHDFRRIKLNDIVSALSDITKKEGINIGDDALEIIAEAAEGGLRDALSILDQIASLGLKKITTQDVEETLGLTPHRVVVDFLSGQLAHDTKKSLKIIENLSRDGSDLIIFTKTLEDVLTKLVTIKVVGADQVEGTKEQVEELEKIASGSDVLEMMAVAERIADTQKNFRSGVDPGFALSLLAISGGDVPIAKVEPEPKSVKAEEVAAPSPKVGAKKKDKRTNGQWQHVLMEIKSKNNTLHAFMRVATPEFEGKELMLCFPYKFHKERIEETKNKKVIEEIVAKVYGEAYTIVCTLVAGGGNGQRKADAGSAASILGGEVLED
ncbi:MAG: DNA polymerase III subunit gamma/tau [Patescibacteria group bacterium]|nr:DNA polymerase III subunit gamma/tau [Patescibacteria group bacterium]